MKILIIAVIIILVIGSYFILNYFLNKTKNSENKYYQGPVPEGYDEEHFRLTGITKPLEDVK